MRFFVELKIFKMFLHILTDYVLHKDVCLYYTKIQFMFICIVTIDNFVLKENGILLRDKVGLSCFFVKVFFQLI